MTTATTTVVTKGRPIHPVNRVGALGPKFSYSDYVGRSIAAEVTLYPTFESLLKALDNNEETHAVIPFENTTVGGVEGLNALLQRQSSTQIVGEYRLPINHALIAGKHIENITQVKTIMSHPQALAQCSNIIESQGWKKKVTASTSAAVNEAIHLPHAAAIGPINSISVGPAHILQKNVQDLPNNLTRFLLLKKIKKCRQAYPINWDRAYIFMSVVLGSHNSRTAVQDAIGVFSSYSVVMRSITAVPRGRKYSFFIEVYFSDKYDLLLKYLDQRESLRLYEVGRAALRELRPPLKNRG
jgi:prephenate dehydratase